MKQRLSLVFCLLLCGCTDADWDRVMRYGGMADTDAAPRPRTNPAAVAVTAQPDETAGAPVAQSANTDFCRAVAMQDASGNGFDPATQQRVFARSYAQCMALNVR